MPNNIVRLSDLYKGNKEASNDLKESSGDIVRLPKVDNNRDSSQLGGPSYHTPDFNRSEIHPGADFLQYSNVDNNEIAAQNQSPIEHLGGSLYNTGLELTLGTASMAGRALDLQSHAALLSGAQDDANNFFSEWIDTLKEDINYDVYRTNWSKGFNPLSTGWWADMMPQLASSLTIAIPVGGILKGASAIGATRGLAKALTGLGSVGKTGAKLAGSYTNLSKGIIGGIASRSIESLAEASQNYKEVYQALVDKGYTDEQAKTAASDSARDTYKSNWLLAASDMLQYTMIMNGFSKKGELLKTIGLEAGEEGYQYVASKEAQYNALRNIKATPEMNFDDRASSYLKDSEFWNSMVGGALGGGVFHAVGEYMNNDEPVAKLNKTVEKVEQQNAAVLGGDKKLAYDGSDDALRNWLVDELQNNTVNNLKDLLTSGLTSTPDELLSQGISPDSNVEKIHSHLKLIEETQHDWDKLNSNPNLTPEAKAIAISSLIDAKLTGQRVAKLLKDHSKRVGETLVEIGAAPNTANLKQLLINREAYNVPELQHFIEPNERNIAKEKESVNISEKELATPYDQSLIEGTRDLALLQLKAKQLTDGFIKASKATVSDEKSAEQLNEIAKKAKLKNIKDIVSKLDSEKLEKIHESVDPTFDDWKPVIKDELIERERKKIQDNLNKETENLNDNSRGFNTEPKEKIFGEDGQVIEEPSNDESTNSVEDKTDLKTEPTSSGEPTEIAKDIISELDNALTNQDSTQDGVPEPPKYEDDYSNFSKNNETLVQWDNRDPNFVWLENPTEALPGTEVYLIINRNNPQHVETVGDFALEIRQTSNNAVIGWVAKNKLMRVRELVWQGSKDNIRYSTKITHKSRGPINNSEVYYTLNELMQGERTFIGFGLGYGIRIPNFEEPNVVTTTNNTEGQVTLIAQSCNGKYFPLSMRQRNLTQDEKAWVIMNINGVTADNFVRQRALVNEVCYIGENSGKYYPNLHLDFNENYVVYADDFGTLHQLFLDDMKYDEHFQENLRRILDHPKKKRNILNRLSNIVGIPYIDPVTNQTYDSYNDFLSESKVLEGNYVPGKIFEDPFIFIDENVQGDKIAPPTVATSKTGLKLPGIRRKTVVPGTYTPIDLNKELNWIKTNYPFIKTITSQTIEDLNNILSDGGPAAWGAFKDATIHIVENSPEGTGYHEAFHAVFDMLLTDSNKKSLYKEASKKYKIDIENTNEIEEKLAEDFKQYMLDIPSKNLTAKIIDFFKRLYHLYRDIIKPNELSIDDLFYRASNGVISMSNKRIRLSKEFQSTVAKRLTVPGMTPEMEQEALNFVATEFLSLVDNRLYDMVSSLEGNQDYYDDYDLIKYEGSIRKKEVSEAYKQALEVWKENGEVGPRPKEIKNNIFSEGVSRLLDILKDNILKMSEENKALKIIHDKFDLTEKEREFGYKGLREKMVDNLIDYGIGIKALDKRVTAHIEEEIEEELQDEVQTKESWQNTYGEADIEEYKIAPKLKRLLRVIPKIKRVISVENGSLQYEAETTMFGTQKYTDYKDLFNIIKRNVYDAANATEMVSIMREVAEDSTFKELYIVAAYLEGTSPENRAMFFTGFSNAHNDYVVLTLDQNVDESTGEKDTKWDYRIFEANRGAVTTNLQSQWKRTFDNFSKDLTKTNKPYTKNFLDNELKVFNEISKKYDTTITAIDAIQAYFKTLGIDLDRQALNSHFSGLIAANRFISDTSAGSINNIHKTIIEGEDPFKKYGSAFKEIATAYKNFFPNLGSDNIKRGGKTIHTYANKTFLNKFIEDIKKSPNKLKEYAYNSVWATLMTNKEFRDIFDIKILSEIRYGDQTGIEYDKLSPADDIIQKILLFNNKNNKSNVAYYNLLTPADNSVMRLIKFKKFSYSYNGKDEIKHFLTKHFAFELSRRLKCKQYVESIKAEKDENIRQQMIDNLVEYYDYIPSKNEVTSTEDKLKMNGNAYKLQHFTDPLFEDLAQRILKGFNHTGATVNINNLDTQELYRLFDKSIREEAIFFKSQLKNFEKLDSEDTTKSPYFDGNVDTTILNWVANTWFANIEQANLFMGGPEFYKNKIDAGKRASQLIAPGEDRHVDENDSPIIRTIVLQTEKFVVQDGPYKGESIDYTDAQGFTSDTEFLDIQLQTGRWNEHLEKHKENILEGNPLPKHEHLSLQPIKPHYYGRIPISDRGISVPTQVKTATVVLDKAYVNNNPKLTVLAEYMKKHNIQQAVFDSAVKVGTRTKMTWNDINNDIEPFVYDLYKRNFKWQQNVPEHHIDSEILYGTQIRKLILAGIDLTDEPTYDVEGIKMSGREVFDLYQKLISQNVNNTLQKTIGTVNNSAKMAKKFQEEVERQELGSQYELSLKLKNDKLIIPPTMSKAFEWLYNAIFDKVVKQRIKGGQFVQVASVGREDLKFVRNEDGVITEAEVYLPWWSTKYIPENEETAQPDLTKVPPALLHAIGYRIPTEAKYSMIQFKVIGFLPKTSGSQIIMSPEVIKQMGSDFDVDKLYVMFYAWTKKDGEYVKDEYYSLEESTQAQRDNKILDLIRSILNNPKHFKELTSSNSFDRLKDLSTEINGKEDNNSAYSLPSQQYLSRINYLDGAALIGVAANTNIHHVVTQFTNTVISTNFDHMIKFDNNGKIPGDAQSLSLSNKTSVDGEDIASTLAQFLAAFVDNAKDPLAAKLNISFLTYPVAALIIRTGNTLETAIKFINQPIIRRLNQLWVSKGSNQYAYKISVSELEKILKDFQPSNKKISTKGLSNNLNKETFTIEQLQILQEFKRIYDISLSVGANLQALRVDSAGVSPNISDNIEYRSLIYNSVSQSIADTENVFNDNSLYPMIPSFTDVLYESINQSSTYFPWGSNVFIDIHNKIRKNNPTAKRMMEQDIANIDLDYLSYIHQELPFLQENEHQKLAYLTGLSSRLSDIISKSKLENASEEIKRFASNGFIKNLVTDKGIIQFAPSVDFSRNEKEQIIDAFRTLYRSNDTFDVPESYKGVSKNLAKSIILYSFYSTGFRKKFGSYLEYIPVDILDELGFRDYWERQLSILENMETDDEFVRRFLRNRANTDKVLFAGENDILDPIRENKVIIQFTMRLGERDRFPYIVKNGSNVYELSIEDKANKVARYAITSYLGRYNGTTEYTAESIFPENKVQFKSGEITQPAFSDETKINNSLEDKMNNITDDEANKRKDDCK